MKWLIGVAVAMQSDYSCFRLRSDFPNLLIRLDSACGFYFFCEDGKFYASVVLLFDGIELCFPLVCVCFDIERVH